MSEKPFTGLTASIKLGADLAAKTLAYVSGADLSLDKEIIEILAFGQQFKEKVPAVKDWSVSIDGTVAFETGGSQEELFQAYEDGTLITVGIYLDATNYFQGTGYVQSIEISAAPDDAITLSAEIAGSGGVTLTLANAAPAPVEGG